MTRERVHDEFDQDDTGWKRPNEEHVRKAFQDAFNQAATHFDQASDTLKAEALELVTHRVSAANPENIMQDLERFIISRIDEQFQFTSLTFKKQLDDAVSRLFWADGRSSREKRARMLDELWHGKKARTAKELEASIRAKEVGRE